MLNNKTWYYRVKCLCCILAFDPAKNAIQSDASEGSDTFQWQLREEIAQVSSADNIGQGEGPTSEWCTGREWPVNSMTVISSRWRSHMPFQRSSGRSSGRWTEVRQLEIGQSYRRDVVGKATSGGQISWGPGKLLIRCSKESHHPAEWASGPPVEPWRTRKTQRWRP